MEPGLRFDVPFLGQKEYNQSMALLYSKISKYDLLRMGMMGKLQTPPPPSFDPSAKKVFGRPG